jgi:hypothetical protein
MVARTYGISALGGPTPNVVGAVPEPETYAMMLAVLVLLGSMARRRKEKEAVNSNSSEPAQNPLGGFCIWWFA